MKNWTQIKIVDMYLRETIHIISSMWAKRKKNTENCKEVIFQNIKFVKI